MADAIIIVYRLYTVPITVKQDGEIVYKIGADFCIRRNTNVTFTILCEILEEDLVSGRARPIPTPNRIWEKDGVIVYNVTDGQNPIVAINSDFYIMTNPLLRPGILDPQNFLPAISGKITFLTRVSSSTKAGVNESIARDQLFDSLLGEWSCSATNVYGSDRATSAIHECGKFPYTYQTQACSLVVLYSRVHPWIYNY